MNQNWKIRMAIVALALAVGACNRADATAESDVRNRDFIRLDPGNPRLSYINVEVAEETDAASNVSFTGRVTFDEDHTQRVASPIDGRVTKVLAQLGDSVKKSQALLELTSPHVAELQAEAQKSQQDLSVAEKAVSRTQQLRQEGAVSDKEAAQVQADFMKAMADAARTAAQLKSLSLSASGPGVNASIRAQIEGTLVERNVLVGQEIRADAPGPLLTISNLDTVWVLADVYEQDLGLVTPGASVSVHVPAYPEESFAGKVGHVGDVLDPMTHTVKLRCLVPNPNGRLKPEMFAKIELTDMGRNKTILLPSRAILTDSEHSRVIVASDDNVYRKRVVEVGPEVDGKVRVRSGLRPGEKVVTTGAIFLKREMESD